MDPEANLWKIPPKMPRLSRSEIHVWIANLDQPVDLLAHYWEYLSGDEQSRANGFVAECHRTRFIVGRATLRALLGHYLQIGPQNLRFEFGFYGKPAIVGEQNPDRIKFNLSHANETAIFAFSRGRELGIDMEFIHAIPDMDRIAARCFSPREYQTWAYLPDNLKEKAFFMCWTRKEAFVKAVGSGFYYPLDKFEVAYLPDDQPRLTWVETDPLAVNRWAYAELPEIPGFATAVISEGNDWRIVCYEYRDLIAQNHPRDSWSVRNQGSLELEVSTKTILGTKVAPNRKVRY